MKAVTTFAALALLAASKAFVHGFLGTAKYSRAGFSNFDIRVSHGARQCTTALSTMSAGAAASLDESISSNLQILVRAAERRDLDSDVVCAALADLEKQMRQKAKEDPEVAVDMKRMLNGDWRLIFTTGTGETQKKFGKINYFPLKAVQSFRTVDCDPMTIENGIYVGDFPIIRFSGTMEFDLRKRRLEFDFDQVLVLSFFDIKLGKGDAAKLGSTSGLGSDSNVKNAEKGRNAFFNWISANEDIATARGAGGGLALWKRV